MRCPFCGFDDTQVKDSRPTDDRAAIRRRRFCPNCAARFTTFERVQLRELTVVKKNGQREPFDRDKLARSIYVALRKRPVERRAGRARHQLDGPPARELGRERDPDATSSAASSWRRSPASIRSPMSASPRSTATSARPRISAISSAGSAPTATEGSMSDIGSHARGAHPGTARPRRRLAQSDGRLRHRRATAVSSAAAGPSPADGRTARPRRSAGPARRRAARPPMSASSRAAIGARRRPAPTR